MSWNEALKAAPYLRLSRVFAGGVLGCVIGFVIHRPSLQDPLGMNLFILLLLCSVMLTTFLPVTLDAANRTHSGLQPIPRKQRYARMAIYFSASSIAAIVIFFVTMKLFS